MTLKSIKEDANYPYYEVIVIDSSYKESEKIGKKSIKDSKVNVVHTQREGMAKARNLGAQNSKGDFLIFLDSHCKIYNNTLESITKFLKRNKNSLCNPCVNVLGNESVKIYGITLKNSSLDTEWIYNGKKTPSEIPIANACCLAATKMCFTDIGMFDDSFKTYGFEDVELSIRAWLLGCTVYNLPYAEISHLFREKFPYDVNQLDIDKNILRTAFLHFDADRIKRVIESIKERRNIDTAIKLLSKTNVFQRRSTLLKKRKHDDDWFFRRFGISV